MTLDLKRMSRLEKIRVMHELWEDLACDETRVLSPEWHEDALRETAGRRADGKEGVRTWAEAKRSLKNPIS